MNSASILDDQTRWNERDERILAEQRAAEVRVLVEGGARIGGPVTDPADPTVPGFIEVRFEGKWCRWADMTLQDRKAYMQGGYPY